MRLTDEEAWDFLASSHTGILTSLRRDGWPVSLPVWFVVLDGAIYVRTPTASKKVTRVRGDERVSFLVESGEAWTDLKAVVVEGRATLVDDDEVIAAVENALTEKYAAFRPDRQRMPEATRTHYSRGSAYIRIQPSGRFLSWDNRKIRMG